MTTGPVLDDPAGQGGGRFRQRLRHLLLAAGATIVFGLLTGAYYLLPRDRSVLLEAATDEVRIVARPEVVWAVRGAVLCRDAPRRRQADAAETPPDSVCGALRRVADGLERLAWPAGSEIALRRPGYGAPTIEVLAGAGHTARRGNETFALESGDLIVLSDAYAPLAAMGHAVLGAASASGPPVRSGRFEWRETLPLRNRPSLIGSGNLHAGDVVQVSLGNCGSDERLIETILVLPIDRNTPGMTVVLSAADADRAAGGSMGLCLTRVGFDRTFIEPRIMDRIVSDPVIYGFGVFLTAALTVFPATLGIADLLALRRRTMVPPASDPEPAGEAGARIEPPPGAQGGAVADERPQAAKE